MSVPKILADYIRQLKPICEYCNVNPSQDIHHEDCNQKNNTPKNLKSVCHKCHMKFGARLENQPRKKLLRIIGQKSKQPKEKYVQLRDFLSKRCPIGCACLKRTRLIERKG